MKKILFLIAINAMTIFMAASIVSYKAVNESEFCTGYKKVYAKGWCYQQVGCPPPAPPVCPVPPVNQNNYEGGYDLGFLQALEDRKD